MIKISYAWWDPSDSLLKLSFTVMFHDFIPFTDSVEFPYICKIFTALQQEKEDGTI